VALQPTLLPRSQDAELPVDVELQAEELRDADLLLGDVVPYRPANAFTTRS